MFLRVPKTHSAKQMPTSESAMTQRHHQPSPSFFRQFAFFLCFFLTLAFNFFAAGSLLMEASSTAEELRNTIVGLEINITAALTAAASSNRSASLIQTKYDQITAELQKRELSFEALVRAYARAQDEHSERERIFKDDIIDPMASTLRRHARRPVVQLEGTGIGSAATCYDLGGTGAKNRLEIDAKAEVGETGAQSVCVFERACWKKGGLVIYGDPDQWKHGTYELPPKITGTSTFRVEPIPDDHDWLSPNKTIANAAWLVTHSYEKHVTHFLEHVAPIFLASSTLPPEALFGLPDDVWLLRHNSDLFDWQKGILKIAMQRENPTIHQGSPREGTCFSKVIVPGFLFEIFEDRLSARAFRTATYDSLSVASPQSPAKRIVVLSRKKKRIMTNEEALITHLKRTVPRGITVDVVEQGKLSFKEQVENMANAGIIIGMHGADLTNCIFLPPGAVMIEVNPKNWMDARFLRACGTNDVHYLSYNDDNGDQSYPFAHFPSVACSKLLKPYRPCKFRGGGPDNNVEVDLTRFEAIFREAMGLLGWASKVIYSPFGEDFDALGVIEIK